MKIAIIGLGCVAMADALALARSAQVTLTGPVPDRVEAINRGAFDLPDDALAGYVQRHDLSVCATLDFDAALIGADWVLVAPPLMRDPHSAELSLHEIESRIDRVAQLAPRARVIVRSSVPVGFTERMQQRHPGVRLGFVPEFSREGAMLRDALHPKFLIVGARGVLGQEITEFMLRATLTPPTALRQMGPTEAEAVRHLSVLFNAARVAYFNELDSYALHHDLNARQIIDGVSLDPRIGAHGNNPCFGYGGHKLPLSHAALAACLPKEAGQILRLLPHVGTRRIDALSTAIAAQGVSCVGVYQRGATVPGPLADLVRALDARGVQTRVQIGPGGDFDAFKDACDLVVSPRHWPELAGMPARLFTRDHFTASPAPVAPGL